MIDHSDGPGGTMTNCRREQEDFAAMRAAQRRGRRAKWRLTLTRIVAGRRGVG